MKRINLITNLQSRFNVRFPAQTFVVMFLAISAFALTIGLTIGLPPQGVYAQTTSPDLINKYNLAVTDAKVAELNEVSQKLVAITEDNPSLVWQNKTSPKGKVLVATWTSWTGYDNQIGQSVNTSRQTWVTTAPEVQEFCKKELKGVTNQSDRNLRLEQLLGLPPNNGKTRFVEFWVNPQDLFRPSADAEINDRTAFGEFTQLPTVLAEKAKPEYVNWFEDLRSKSYNAVGGYPWTRMGYTYDWGNPKSEIGVSEFVINSGVTIDVKSVQPNDKYCVS